MLKMFNVDMIILNGMTKEIVIGHLNLETWMKKWNEIRYNKKYKKNKLKSLKVTQVKDEMDDEDDDGCDSLFDVAW